MTTQQDNAQDHNIPTPERGSGHTQDSNGSVAEFTPQDPTTQAQRPVTKGPVTVGTQEHAEDAAVEPHEVRARLTRRGAVHGLELDTGSGVVFIPQHALPDLRRRLFLAQERFTAMSGPVPGRRRRRPASAR